MTSRSVETDIQRAMLIRLIEARTLPFTVEIVDGRRRSSEQNRLQRQWINEIAEQLGDRTPEEVRAECKLRFGVPILRAESEIFRKKYDRLIKSMPYETKLELMAEPMDFPITRLMNVKQKTQYLDAIQRHYAEQGVVLTQPESQALADNVRAG